LTRSGDNNLIASFRLEGDFNEKIIEKKSAMLGGSLSLGYGKFVYPEDYIGCELGLDVINWKTRRGADNTLYTEGNDYGPDYGAGVVRLKHNKLIPAISTRVGVYCDSLQALFYAKGGVAYVLANLHTLDGVLRMTRLTPTIGIGVEKSINRRLSCKLEYDYRICAKRKKVFKYDDCVNEKIPELPSIHHYSKLCISNRGYIVRLMASVHI
jgi:opacity protein-like surface antigen